MDTKTYLYRVVNEIGNSFDGFDSQEEAQNIINNNVMKPGHIWRVQEYEPVDWE